jgi:hypothetical protein
MIEGWSNIVQQVVTASRERGLQFPIVLGVVTQNGSLYAVRYDRAGAEVRGKILADHAEQDGRILPANIMVTDMASEVLRARIASSFAELERTRSFCRFLTFAGSPFRLARKIRSCSLRTLRSTAGQSMLDQL